MTAHKGIVSTTGPNSGVGTVKADMPAMSSTASAACCAPTVARPSSNTAQ
jgi:hypothetical protein